MGEKISSSKTFKFILVTQIVCGILFGCSLLELYLVYAFGGFGYFGSQTYDFYANDNNYLEHDAIITFSEDSYSLELIFTDNRPDNHRELNIAKESIQTTLNNGIFSELISGDTVQVICTYMMNGTHNNISWVAEIKINDSIFLSFNDGKNHILQDIVSRQKKYITYTVIGVGVFVPACSVFIVVSIYKKKNRVVAAR